MKHDKKYIVWSNWNLDIDDERWKDFFEQMEEDYIENFGEGMSDDEKWQMLYDEINMWLDDERANLNIKLNDEIIVLGDEERGLAILPRAAQNEIIANIFPKRDDEA